MTYKEIFKTKCLPGIKKNTDFNGLGSSNTHLNNKIYLSIGTPEQSSQEIAILAQDKNSMFGKILEIDKMMLRKNWKHNKVQKESWMEKMMKLKIKEIKK